MIDTTPIRYTDTEVMGIGKLDDGVKDVISKNKIPVNGIFFKQFTFRETYLMFGSRYNLGRYGSIILYSYSSNRAEYRINNNVLNRIN